MGGFVELAVPAAVEAVMYNSSGIGFQRRGAVGHRELGFGGVTGGSSTPARTSLCHPKPPWSVRNSPGKLKGFFALGEGSPELSQGADVDVR